jgi:hypothetical protein
LLPRNDVGASQSRGETRQRGAKPAESVYTLSLEAERAAHALRPTRWTATTPSSALAGNAPEASVFASAAEWLNKGLLPALKVHLGALGAVVPERTRINRGFPPKRGWAREARRAPGVLIFPAMQDADGNRMMGTADGYHDIFVNPRISDPLDVATVVLHYLALAALGVPPRSSGQSRRLQTYSRKSWRTLSGLIGFVGTAHEMRAGPRLANSLDEILGPLGRYPEGEVERHNAGDDRSGNRHLKIWCPLGASSSPASGDLNEHFQGRSTEHYRHRLPNCAVCGSLLSMTPPRTRRQ